MSNELIGIILTAVLTLLGLAISWGRFEQKTNGLRENYDKHVGDSEKERDLIWKEIQKVRDAATIIDKDLARIHMEIEKEITTVALNVQMLSGKIDQIWQGVEELKKMMGNSKS